MAANKQFIANLKGPKGDPGPQGEQGNQGVPGATGQRGSRWDVGTAMTGFDTAGVIFAESGLAASLENDQYLNTLTGNVYRCIKAGDADEAVWVYVGNIKPENEDDYITGRKADGKLEDSAEAPFVSIIIKGASGMIDENVYGVGETGVIEIRCASTKTSDEILVSVPVDTPLFEDEYIYYDITGRNCLYKNGQFNTLDPAQIDELAKLSSFDGGTIVESEGVIDIVYFKNNDDAEAVIFMSERVKNESHAELTIMIGEVYRNLNSTKKELLALINTKADEEVNIVNDNFSECTSTEIDDTAINDTCYGAGKFVAATPNSIYYSIDGSTWEEAAYDDYAKFVSVIYAGDKFVAVDSTGYIHTSNDGVEWTKGAIINESITNIVNITYGNGLYVVIDRNAVWYSSNLTTWNNVTYSNITNADRFTKVRFCGDRFVAVGSYSSNDTMMYGIYYSTNGSTWTLSRSSKTANYTDVAYNDGTYVAVGTNSSSSYQLISYSTDFSTWNDVDSSIFTRGGFNEVIYDKYNFIAVGTPGGVVAISKDGINWTVRNICDENLYHVAYGDFTIVATGRNSNIIYKTKFRKDVKTVETALNDIYAAIRKLGGDL